MRSPEKAHLAFDRPQQAGQRAHQRRLAGAVGAEDRDQLARGDFEIAPAALRLRRHSRPTARCTVINGFSRNREAVACGRAPLARRRPGRPRSTAGSARHLSGRSLGDLGAGVEHDDMVRDAHHQIHVVLDQDHGHARRPRACATTHRSPRYPAAFSPAAGSSSASTLGADRKRAGDLDQPLVDMRERTRRPIERTAVADEGEQAFGDLGIVAVLPPDENTRRRAGRAAARSDIVDHRHVSNSWLV